MGMGWMDGYGSLPDTWITDYLTDQPQYVRVESYRSEVVKSGTRGRHKGLS